MRNVENCFKKAQNGVEGANFLRGAAPRTPRPLARNRVSGWARRAGLWLLTWNVSSMQARRGGQAEGEDAEAEGRRRPEILAWLAEQLQSTEPPPTFIILVRSKVPRSIWAF